jgi:hypothetical protein
MPQKRLFANVPEFYSHFRRATIKIKVLLYLLSTLHYTPTLTQILSTFPYPTKPTRLKNSILYHALVAMHCIRAVDGYTNINVGTDGTP